MSLHPRLREAPEDVQDAFAAGRAVIAQLREGTAPTDDDVAVLERMFEARERMGWDE